MAFKFVPVETVKRVVNIEIPGDFGKVTKADFEAEFRRLTVTQARDLVKQIREKTADEEAVIRENVVSIKGIKDADGQEIPFSSELLTRLCDEAYIRGPLLAGIMDVNFALDKLRQKN